MVFCILHEVARVGSTPAISAMRLCLRLQTKRISVEDRSFKKSRSRSVSGVVLKTALMIAVVAGAVYVLSMPAPVPSTGVVENVSEEVKEMVALSDRQDVVEQQKLLVEKIYLSEKIQSLKDEKAATVARYDADIAATEARLDEVRAKSVSFQ